MITKVVVIQDKKEFFMAETKKKGKKRTYTAAQKKKFAADKKAKSESAANQVLDKIYAFVATPKGEWSKDDGELDISFYRSKVAGFPMNFEGKDYRGMNAVQLIEAMENNDVCVPKFATFNQVKDLIESNKDNLPPKSDDFDPDNPLKGRKTISPVHKWLSNYYEDGERVTNESRIRELEAMTYAELKDSNVVKKAGLKWAGNVFALEQLEDLLPKDYLANDPMFIKKRELDAVRMSPEKENAYFRQKTQNLINAMGVKVIEKEGSNRCYFSPSENHIVVPPRHRFKNEESRLAILCHELVHSTGLPLGREFAPKSDPNYDIKYAKEEIITEMATSFISYRLGIKSFTAHAQYMKHYADIVCKDDNKKVLMSLSSEAMKASDYVMEKLEAYELKQAQKLEQSLEQGIKPSNIAVEGDQISQTFDIDGKKVVAVVDLQDIDNVSFINEKHLNEFALAKPTAKELDEVKTELKSKLREYTVANYDINLEMLRCDELQRKTQNLEVANEELQPEQKQRNRTALRA